MGPKGDNSESTKRGAGQYKRGQGILLYQKRQKKHESVRHEAKANRKL